MNSSNNSTATTPINPTKYPYRNRADIKRPTAFPVAFSPLRNRSTKRTSRGYKTTATVKMPVKVNSDHVSKTWDRSAKMNAEHKAAMRAVRLEARRMAKGKQSSEVGCEGAADEDVDEGCDCLSKCLDNLSLEVLSAFLDLESIMPGTTDSGLAGLL